VEFKDALFDALRRMDGEASVEKDGYPTGLAWYGGYFRPECVRPPTETSWTRRLAQLLPEYGFPTRAEVPYPAAPRCRCDNVVTLPGGGRLWLENKGAWKDYWVRKGGVGIYRAYLLHPLVPNLQPKGHTVPLDLKKLDPLGAPDAEAVGFLLLGFDAAAQPMDGDVAEMAGLAGLDRAPWVGASTTWDDRYRPGCRVLCWYWQRTVEVIGS